MFFKKIAIVLALLMVSLCGCNNLPSSVNSRGDNISQDGTQDEQTSITTTENNNLQIKEDSKDVDILNFTQPEIGEEIVVISIKDYGTIKIKLFEDECPKGVENFKRLISEKNYYDNVIFHRVIENFVIQAGDPKGNGTGGESIWGEGFEREFNNGLRHFMGAVAYATNSVDHLNKSQFYIVCQNNGSEFNDSYFNMTEDSYGIIFPNNVRDKYREVGGTPFLDNNYEVFGQVFDGLDVIMKISQVETDNNDKPYENVIIESATIQKYDGKTSANIGDSETITSD